MPIISISNIYRFFIIKIKSKRLGYKFLIIKVLKTSDIPETFQRCLFVLSYLFFTLGNVVTSCNPFCKASHIKHQLIFTTDAEEGGKVLSGSRLSEKNVS